MKTIFLSILIVVLLIFLVIYFSNISVNMNMNKNNDKITMTPYMRNYFLDYTTKRTLNKYEQERKILEVYLCMFYLLNENYDSSKLKKIDDELKLNPKIILKNNGKIKYYTWSKYDNLRHLFMNTLNDRIVESKNYLTNDYNRNYKIICDVFNDVVKECKIEIV